MVLVLAPLYFDGRKNGIGRLSGGVVAAFERHFGAACRVWSSNDPVDAQMGPEDRAFGGAHSAMMLAALKAPKPPGVQLVYATHLGLSPVAWVLARRWGVPVGVFLHGVECWARFPLRTSLFLRRVDGFCCNSFYTRERFHKAHPAYRGIPCAVSHLAMPEDFKLRVASRAMPTATAGQGPVRILSVGRIVKSDAVESGRLGAELYKGFKPLLEAAELAADGSPPLEVRIVGDGDARRDLEAWARANIRRVSVFFTGKVTDEELAEEYARASFFAMPSEREGFGYVFVEAMAYGLPCVCLSGTAPEEIVLNEKTGLTAPSGDLSSLAACLRRLATDSELRARLGAGARARYDDYFQARHFEERFLAAARETRLIR